MSIFAQIFGRGTEPRKAPKRGRQPEQVRPEVLVAEAAILDRFVQEPGWQLVLDMMERRMDKAESEMLLSKSSDPLELLALQRRARAYREIFDGVQQDIQRTINDAKELSDADHGPLGH